MKLNQTILTEFIKDFKLDSTGKAIFFDADIQLKTATISKRFNCEVHIISMVEKNMVILYLLYPELGEQGLPDTFPFDPNSFSYAKNKSLTIEDYDLLRGKYSLEIMPLKAGFKLEATHSLHKS